MVYGYMVGGVVNDYMVGVVVHGRGCGPRLECVVHGYLVGVCILRLQGRGGWSTATYMACRVAVYNTVYTSVISECCCCSKCMYVRTSIHICTYVHTYMCI